MRKVSKFFLLISLSFLLTFNSCNNVFENTVSSDDEVQTASAHADKKTPAEESPAAGNTSKSKQPVTIEFGGSLKLKGAVPVEFVEPKEPEPVNQNSRSANAQLPTGDEYEYYVSATSNTGDFREDVHAVSNTEISYTLQLEVNKTWTFTAGLRKKASGTPNTDSYVAPKDLLIDNDTASGHSYSLALSDTTLQPAQQKTFMLRPLQTSSGQGTIDLTMSAPESGSGIDDLKLFVSGENGLLQPWKTDVVEITSDLEHLRTKEGMKIASGSYDVTMIFYKGAFQAYITYQTINVFDNMETKIWASGNAPGADSIINGSTFQVTNSLVQKFASSTIYVGAPVGVTVEPDDSRVGSPYAPLRTLNKAFELIMANTGKDGSTRDYRIYVTTAKPTTEKAAQPQKANLEIPAGIISGNSGNAKSIEIIGLGSGDNLAVLEPEAGNGAGTVLTVNTTVPVKLSNIKITGGQGSGGKGGAISITQNDAKVTLGAGTVISGNLASDQGGGIYIQGTDASHKPKLIIQNGAEITSNSIANGGTGGMAIFADCAEVEMTGGEISRNNKAGAQYGAVRLTGASEFTMTGGSVANNDGGAFYVDSTYDSGTSTYTHSKLKIGGSARIPYGVNGTTGQKKNDVYIVRANQTDPSGGKYSPLEIAGAITVEEGTKIAAITPDGWQRGLDILKTNNGVINDYKDYFITTDPYFILSNQATAQISKLKAPVVVSNNPSNDPSINPSDSNSGTREHPYATLAFALSQLGGGEEDTILIDGLISTPSEEPNGKYEIPASFIVSQCSALTLKGANGLNTDGTPKDGFAVPEGGSGSVLTVDSPVPVKIENLKLTGGKGTYNDIHYLGGGLYLNRGTVTLADGAQITGNSATHGAGILIESNGTLYMYGSSLIGEKKGGNITSAPSVYSQASNYSSAGPGGGIYSYGNVFIGYERWASDTDNTPKAMAEGYGILHNYAGTHGGGIISMGGKFRMASGTIGINYSDDNGGGFCDIGCTDCVIAGGSIEGNVATNGGAIYIYTDKIAELKNNLEIKNNEATTAGGAVYVAGTLKIQDAVSIPYGVNGSLGAKKNDVYLSTDKTITVSGSFSSSAPDTVATITLPSWTRGTQFLGVGGSLGALPNGIENKFDFTDLGWEKKPYKKTNSNANDAVKIDSDIYVAGTSPEKCKTSDEASAPTDEDNTKGTWAHPFASIKQALDLVDSTHETIIIDGTVTGARQEIPASFNKELPDGLTIKGYKASLDGTSSAAIKRFATTPASASTSGQALLIKKNITVTIEDLTITGGYASGNGGGIYLAAGTLKLGDGVKVTGNCTNGSGGGVYVASGTKLFMYGSSMIGDDTATTASSATLGTGCANTASTGGGIYSEGAVYIGYDGLNGDTPNKHDMKAGYGVCRNYASGTSTSGGGIQSYNGTLMIASGSVSYNQTVNHGGGIYGVKTVTIEEPSASTNKLVMYGNKAKVGGAICLYTGCNLTMSGGQIGGSDSGQQNTATDKGGALYQGSTFKVSGSAFIYPSTTANTNDVFLPKKHDSYISCVAAGSIGTGGNSSTQPMPLTPELYNRGTEIVLGDGVTVNEALWSKFALTSDDDAGWERKKSTVDSKDYVAITSPIYVVDATDSSNTRPSGFEKGKTVAAGANGTKTSPYASVADALTCADLATVNEITVAGTLKGAQTISATSISELKLKGYKASGDTVSSAKIDAGGATGAGSALTVNKSGLTVTITDLTITGGTGSDLSGGTAKNGGGIYLNAGIVKLADGAVVTGNQADAGGGVYLNSGNLFLYGSAVVGKSGVNSHATNSSGGYGNKATVNGGGIAVNEGTLYIGYSSAGTPADTSGGVIYNLAISSNEIHGGGIDNTAGTVYIARGNVSYNYACSSSSTNNGCGGGISTAKTVNLSGNAVIEGNSADNGGAFYITYNYDNHGSLTMSGGSIVNNAAACGGAVYNIETFAMSGGKIGESGKPNSVTGSSGNGGAIYQGGTFKISGSAIVYAGSEKSNDVYIVTGKYISLPNNSFSGSATITPSAWNRGKQVLDGDYAGTHADKFSVTDSDWSVVADSSVGKLNTGTTIYVSNSGNDSTGRGTSTKPYATIQTAAKETWKAQAYTISVNGTLKATSTDTLQSIPDDTKVKASSITLSGSNSATINANSKGTALTISKNIPVYVKNITITGGSANNGGGLYVGTGSVYLEDGAVITGNSTPTNNATYGGAGAYVASGAKLFMYGTARIGGSGTTAATTSSGNYGYSGGGILSAGNVYLGYNACASSTGVPADSEAKSLTGGVTQNYAESTGGGITLHGSGKLYLKTGNISYNNAKDGGSNTKGGGIACDAGTSVTMAGGTIAGNKAQSGGGVYLLGNDSYTTTFTMSGGTIGKAGTSSDPVNAAAESTAGKHSNYASSGAGIYAGAKTSVTITGGNIKYNYATSYGGALYWSGATLSVNKSGSTFGTLSYNRAVKGGAVYFNANGNLTQAMMNNNQADNMGGAIYISGSKNVEINGAMKINSNETVGSDSYTASGGGIYNAGNLTISGSVQMQSNTANGKSNNGWGGAIFNTSSLIITGAMTMDSNSAVSTGSGKTAYGGAIYNSGSITMSAGSIGSSTSNYVSAASAANAQGGAIYVYGTATISGTAYVKYGNSTKPNDIYLSSTGKTIGLDSSLSNHSASDQVGVTLGGTWNTGTAVLSGSANNIKSHYMKIKLTNNSTRFVDSDGTLRQGAAATPANAAAAVANLTSGGTLKLTGNPTAQQILDIRDALYNTYKNYSDANMPSIVIDLSDTTITSIPENAFWPAIDSGSQCEAISSVKLPTTVTSIGKNAFAYCSNMTSITGYTQVTSLGDGAFEFCSSLTSFTIPSGLTSKKVPDSLLYGCGNITSIIIPSGFTEIGDSAFFNAGLTSVTIPSSVTTIDRLAFNYCKFTTFTVPSSVTTLGEYFMSNNKSLTSVTIPNNSISKIPDYAFTGCSALRTVNYSSNITEIGKQAFEECTSLTSFTVKTNVRKVGYCFLWKSGNINTITFEVTSGWKYKNGNTETSVDSIIANQTDLKNALIGVLGQHGYSLGNSQDWYR